MAMEEARFKDEIRFHKIDYEAEAAKKDAIDVIGQRLARRGVEAFILPTKRIAMYGFNALNVLGLSMPKDFSFVCFDESDVYELNKPVVPHIIQPLSEIAFKSFELLQKMIDNKVTEEEKTSLLNVKLVLGGRFGGESTQASF